MTQGSECWPGFVLLLISEYCYEVKIFIIVFKHPVFHGKGGLIEVGLCTFLYGTTSSLCECFYDCFGPGPGTAGSENGCLGPGILPDPGISEERGRIPGACR